MSSFGGYGTPPPAPPPRDERNTWIWIAVGCGGLALLALCLVPPVLYFVVSDGEWLPDPDANPPPSVPAPTPAPGPTAPGILPRSNDPQPRHVTVSVEHASGIAGLAVGSTCEFDVTREPRDDGTFWCNAQITCGGRLLYGGPTAGFFECTLYEQPQRHVVGEDPMTTTQDRDAAMRIDTLRSEFSVRDDASGANGAFEVRGRVTAVR